MIDWGRISELRGEIGEDDFDEVVEIFLEEVEEVLQRLGSSQGNNLVADLHYLKGCALNLGFKSLSQLCSEGEDAINAGQPVDPNEIVETFHKARQMFALGVSQSQSVA